MLNRGIFFTILLLLAACANRVTPTGGEKDLEAPKLLESIPADRSTRFSGREIRLRFDEYVQLNDLQGQFLISPLTGKMPDVKANKKEILITLPDTLLPNTTYTLSFGHAIVDIHEFNPLKDFQYVFSTGEYLDSLELTGKVVDAAVHNGLKNITVLMYRFNEAEGDSVVCKRKPDYFTRTNEQGEFRLRNMAAGSYRLFALDDRNSNYLCDNPADEPLAFHDFNIVLPGSYMPELQLALMEPYMTRLVRANRMDRHSVMLSFNKTIDSLQLVSPAGQPWDGRFYGTAFQDTLYLFQPDTVRDSLMLLVKEGGRTIDTVSMSLVPPKGIKDAPTRLRIFQRISPAGMGPESPLILNANHPLAAADSAEVIEDSSKAVRVPVIITDSLQAYFKLDFPWQSGKRYKVNLYPDCIRDMYGYSNDTVKLEFLVPGPESTAMLSVKTQGLKEGRSYLLQILNEKFELLRQVNTEGDTALAFSYLNPGPLKLRIIEDIDRNGGWTYGHFGKRRQPEPVWIYPEALTLRSNWELEVLFRIYTD
ncbi:MAG: Ig-like domain-containing protein [Bacteroidia bacterium]|nr:Ig-like domain-containing protein [Bacteroidia bacterium]